MNEQRSGTLVVVGGWGVRCEMLSGLYDQWPGKVITVTLDDELMSSCDSVSDVADELLGRYPEPAVWLGWSLGAQIVMAAAQRQTGAVTAVVTSGGFPRFTVDEGWASGMPQREFEAFARGIAKDPERYWLHFLLLMINGDRHEQQARKRLKPWLEAGVPVSNASLDKGLDWLRSGDQRALWAGSSTPALHLMGEQDAVVRPWSDWQDLAGCHRARVVSGMAHWPAEQAAMECQQIIADFLDEPVGAA